MSDRCGRDAASEASSKNIVFELGCECVGRKSILRRTLWVITCNACISYSYIVIHHFKTWRAGREYHYYVCVRAVRKCFVRIDFVIIRSLRSPGRREHAYTFLSREQCRHDNKWRAHTTCDTWTVLRIAAVAAGIVIEQRLFYYCDAHARLPTGNGPFEILPTGKRSGKLDFKKKDNYYENKKIQYNKYWKPLRSDVFKRHDQIITRRSRNKRFIWGFRATGELYTLPWWVSENVLFLLKSLMTESKWL